MRAMKCGQTPFNQRVVLVGFCLLSTFQAASGLDHVSFLDGNRPRKESGRALLRAQDGGLMFESQDGQIWTIQPDASPRLTRDEAPFTYLSRQELAKRVLAELPSDFKVHNTQNYIVVYNTSRAYAQWCGALFERLQRGFLNFWSRKGLKLEKPRPMVALVFRDRKGYSRYGRPELGPAAGSVIGYYSLKTNRMTTFDLTGMEQLRQAGDRRASSKQIRAILSRPAAERTVSTLIHEATHQLSFNSGLQTRFADNPLWLSEGLAIYFEAPDLSSSRGWKKIGALHPSRLKTMRDYAARRPRDSLMALLTDDQRLRNVATAPQGYAESWALCYFLIRHHPQEFRNYLKLIGSKPVADEDKPEVRIADFEQSFGSRWQEIDAEFLKSLAEWR